MLYMYLEITERERERERERENKERNGHLWDVDKLGNTISWSCTL